MTREPSEAKVARLLASGALQILEVTRIVVRARCQGDSGRTWRLGWQQRGGWGCQCPAGQFSRADCAHLVALQRVLPPREDTAPVPLTASRLLEEQAEASRVRNGTTRRTA